MKHTRRRTALVAFLALTVFSTLAFAQFRRRRPAPTGEIVRLKHDGRDREYRIHVPQNYDRSKPAPLVVCLHGGGGSSEQVSRMGMTPVADRHGFIIVYPNAIDRHWGDGRESQRFAEQEKTVDDVSFITAVVDQVRKEYNIDADRVFATGMSNGGFMSQRLAMEKSEVFAAVGIVIASMGEPLQEEFAPKLPVSVVYINGTDDPLVPYDGGEIRVNLTPRLNKLLRKSEASRGRCIPTDDAVALWVNRNHTATTPEIKGLPDRSRTDGSTVELSLWKDGERGTAVALYKVIGGGHTLAGTTQYLPERLIGRTNRDFDGFEAIWQFFDEYARDKPASNQKADNDSP